MRCACLVFLFAILASAQATDGINVSVTRVVNIVPDEANFNIVVLAPLDTTQDQAAQALRGAGLPELTLLNVAAGQSNYTYPPPQDSQIFYQFTFTAAPSALTEYGKKLDALRAKPPETITIVQYTAVLNASAAAINAAHDSTLPKLLSEARSKAESLATAAGLKVGPITGLTESFYGVYGLSSGFMLSPPFLSVGSSGSSSPATQYSFYASVKFAAQ